MTVQVKLPTPDELKLREVEPGLWGVQPCDKKSDYNYFELSTVFERGQSPADQLPVQGSRAAG